MTPSQTGRTVIVSDVDGTLIRPSSLIDLMSFDAHERGVVDEARACVERVQAARRRGLPRSQTAEVLIQWWAEREIDDVDALARRWAAANVADRERFWHERVVAEVHRQVAKSGARLVLVSASFAAPLRPLAAILGADEVVCSELTVVGGRYTGDISSLMLGEAKAAAVTSLCSGAAVSMGYGDHLSDFPMLEITDIATVVAAQGVTSVEVEQGRRRGWRVLHS